MSRRGTGVRSAGGRTGHPVETPEYAQMVGRMVRALGRRFGQGRDGDVPDLALFAMLRSELDAAERAAVERLREDYGYSWAEVAAGLGTTRQAAQQRHGRGGARHSRGDCRDTARTA